jgi:hypothetical protein
MAKSSNRKKVSKVAPVVTVAPAPADTCLGVDDLQPPIRERLFGGDAGKELDGNLELFDYVDGEQTDEEKLVRDLILFFRRAESRTERDKAFYSMLEFLRNYREPSIMGPRKPRRMLAALCALIVAELQRDVVRMLREVEL